MGRLADATIDTLGLPRRESGSEKLFVRSSSPQWTEAIAKRIVLDRIRNGYEVFGNVILAGRRKTKQAVICKIDLCRCLSVDLRRPQGCRRSAHRGAVNSDMPSPMGSRGQPGECRTASCTCPGEPPRHESVMNTSFKRHHLPLRPVRVLAISNRARPAVLFGMTPRAPHGSGREPRPPTDMRTTDTGGGFRTHSVRCLQR